MLSRCHVVGNIDRYAPAALLRYLLLFRAKFTKTRCSLLVQPRNLLPPRNLLFFFTGHEIPRKMVNQGPGMTDYQSLFIWSLELTGRTLRASCIGSSVSLSSRLFSRVYCMPYGLFAEEHLSAIILQI